MLQTSDKRSQVTGGSWALPVYYTLIKNSGYAGSIFRTVTGGKMNWDLSGTSIYPSAEVSLDLDITLDTMSWVDVKGTATLLVLSISTRKPGP